MSRQVWRCYSVRSEGTYGYRNVDANNFEEAELEYKAKGMHKFVWAEPLIDSVNAIGESPSSIGIDLRLKQLKQTDQIDNYTMAVLEAPPGPRKPIPAIPPEVHHVVAFDADKAWEATIAISKGA